jgi:hypothetical protein
MPVREPRAHGASDLMLVLAIAALVLVVVLVSRCALPSQSAAYLVLPTHTALSRVEKLVPAPDARAVATMAPAHRVPATPAPRTAISSRAAVVAACPPRLDLEHDLRLVLAAMALHKRRIPRERPAGYYGTPYTQDVPAKDRALAGVEESVARAEASPWAARRPHGPGC